MTRIAYVCADPGVPVFGRKGCSVHVQEVLRALLQHGAQVELFAARFDGEPPADLRSVATHALPPIPKGELAMREAAAQAVNPVLAGLLERTGPFDLVYERYSLWSFAAMELSRSLRVPGVLEVNAPLIDEQAAHRGLADRAAAETVARRVFQAAAVLSVVSQELAEYLGDWLPPIGHKVYVIPNGINPARFPLELSRRTEHRKFTVGFVGSLKPWHGLATLGQAFALLHQHEHDVELLIVGDGPERENLAAGFAADPDLSAAVRFTGAVPPDQVPGWLASMDVAVAPYSEMNHFYFSPLKVYEYMAAGLPVVAARIGQLNELIQHEVNGLLYPPDDSTGMAAELRRLYHDPALRDRLGRAARETVVRGHTWEMRMRRVLELSSAVAGDSNNLLSD